MKTTNRSIRRSCWRSIVLPPRRKARWPRIVPGSPRIRSKWVSETVLNCRNAESMTSSKQAWNRSPSLKLLLLTAIEERSTTNSEGLQNWLSMADSTICWSTRTRKRTSATRSERATFIPRERRSGPSSSECSKRQSRSSKIRWTNSRQISCKSRAKWRRRRR